MSLSWLTSCWSWLSGLFSSATTPTASTNKTPAVPDEQSKSDLADEQEAPISEFERTANLFSAQEKAITLFTAIETQLLRSGVSEKQFTSEIYALGNKMFDLKATNWWHKRIVRSGPNILSPFRETISDCVIQDDDILFIDLGPIFESYEADFGRTFVLGSDPHKLRLLHTLEPVWRAARDAFLSNPDNITAAELFKIVSELAAQHGYTHGAEHAGHLIGQWAHENISDGKVQFYVIPKNGRKMKGKAESGRNKGCWRHWILEVHLHDTECGFGGFMEQLLTIDENGKSVWEQEGLAADGGVVGQEVGCC